jgi:hypothetical protein
MDPFILEQRAYERIESVCSEERNHFPPSIMGRLKTATRQEELLDWNCCGHHFGQGVSVQTPFLRI